MRWRFPLGRCCLLRIYCRDIEKASNEVFSYFENMQSSMLCVITASTEITNAYDKDPVLKDTLSRYKNMYSISTSKIEKELVCSRCSA